MQLQVLPPSQVQYYPTNKQIPLDEKCYSSRSPLADMNEAHNKVFTYVTCWF